MKYKFAKVSQPTYSAELVRRRLLDMIERADDRELIKMYAFANRIKRYKAK